MIIIKNKNYKKNYSNKPNIPINISNIPLIKNIASMKDILLV